MLYPRPSARTLHPNVAHILLVALAFISLSPTVLATSAKPLISRFQRCSALNDYYRHALLPLVTDTGINTGSVNVQSLYDTNNKFDPGTPGGPARLMLRRRRGQPLRFAFSNLTNFAADAEEHDEPAPPSSVQFTGTNVQVLGVEEPDIIKTDGARLFTLVSYTLSVVRVLEGGRRGRRVGRLRLPTRPSQMLIDGNYLLLLGSTYNRYSRPAYSRFKKPLKSLYAVVIYQVHIGMNDVPSLVQTLTLEGKYIRAQKTGGVARIVLRYDPLSNLRLLYSSLKPRRQPTKRWNREIIEQSRPGMWLPTYLLRRADGVLAGVYTSCTDVYRASDEFAGFAMLSVLTLRVDARLLAPKQAASLLSDAEKVYSTKKTMYATTSEFRIADDDNASARSGSNFKTSVHKFALGPTDATYVASGRITGSVINQFAMHEWHGTFFIATMDGPLWWSKRDVRRSKVSSFRTDKKSQRLVKIGEVGELGVDERIYAVRYRWDTAYVVTFRETNPLYIIDISNPRKLRVTGGLKIPGFSSYLHIVGPGLVLGVGQETESRLWTGVRVSLFDVSDKSDPKELSVWTMKGSETSVQFDHRAFLWYRKERLAVIPVSVYERPKTFFNAIVLHVSNTEITERGMLKHLVDGNTPNIRRNVVIGSKYLWSMSTELLQVNNVNNLSKIESKAKISSY